MKRALLIALLTSASAIAQEESPSPAPPDAALMSVPPDEQSMIEHACSQARYLEGLASFRSCIDRMLADLAQAPPAVDLSDLSADEQSMIEHACTQERYAQGPAAYRRCRANQLAALRKGPGEHDLSSLSPDEQAMIDHACSQERYVLGPAAYRKCVGRQMADLESAPSLPDLSQLPTEERSMLDRVCGRERYLQGPAAYRNCVRRQLAEMAAALAATGDSHAVGADGVRRDSTSPPRSSSTQQGPAEGQAPSTAGDKTAGEPATQASDSSWGASLVVLTAIACLALFAAFVYRHALSASERCPSCRRGNAEPGRLCPACDARLEEARRTKSEHVPVDGDAGASVRPPAEKGSPSDSSRAGSLSIEDLERMDPPAFEDLVADLFRESGYGVLRPGDGGDEDVDLVLSANGAKDLVRCGQRNAKLGLSTLHRFYISMMRAGASHGFVLTTASFQHSAHAFARERAISLIDGTGLLEWIHGQPPDQLRTERRSPFPGDDPHAILGISRSATRKQIRQAYVALLKKYHPDRVAHLGEEFRALAEERTQAINRAYEALLNNS